MPMLALLVARSLNSRRKRCRKESGCPASFCRTNASGSPEVRRIRNDASAGSRPTKTCRASRCVPAAAASGRRPPARPIASPCRRKPKRGCASPPAGLRRSAPCRCRIRRPARCPPGAIGQQIPIPLRHGAQAGEQENIRMVIVSTRIRPKRSLRWPKITPPSTAPISVR